MGGRTRWWQLHGHMEVTSTGHEVQYHGDVLDWTNEFAFVITVGQAADWSPSMTLGRTRVYTAHVTPRRRAVRARTGHARRHSPRGRPRTNAHCRPPRRRLEGSLRLAATRCARSPERPADRTRPSERQSRRDVRYERCWSTSAASPKCRSVRTGCSRRDVRYRASSNHRHEALRSVLQVPVPDSARTSTPNDVGAAWASATALAFATPARCSWRRYRTATHPIRAVGTPCWTRSSSTPATADRARSRRSRAGGTRQARSPRRRPA